MSVPREGTKDAAIEAIRCNGIKLVNILTEGLARRDSAEILQAAKEHNVRVVGPSSIGIINPLDRVKLGAIGGNDPGVFYPGEIAVFSKSGGMCLSIATEVFNVLGHGTSIVVGIGGDRISGTNFKELLELVRDDDRTKMVILNGEVGGDYEEEAARYIRETKYPKPVVARITGIGAGKHLSPRFAHGSCRGDHRRGQTGHLRKQGGSLRARRREGGQDLRRVDFLRRAGHAAKGPDLEAALSKEFELVSISKQKLEKLKSQVRAVQLRTHLTRIVDGTPYFRGRPLPQLMRQSSIPQMIYEALTKEDDGAELGSQLTQDLIFCATTNPRTRPCARRPSPRLRAARR